MSATKKRRVEDEGRTFQEQWTNKYFFVAHAEKALCLVCKKSIPVMKDYNLRRHFEKNHEAYQLLIGEKRTQKIEKLKKEMAAQQFMFKKSNQEAQASTHASYVVAYEIAKRGKPFVEGEFVKDCMLKVAEIVCPDKQPAFQNVSLSRMTITRRVEEIGTDIKEQLNSDVEKYVSVSLALDESTDIGSTAQLLVFIRGVTEDFQISEELFAMVSLKDRTRGSDLCDAVSDAIDKSNLQWSQLVGVTTDGAPSMTGKESGFVTLLRKKAMDNSGSDLIHYHCIIHQEALVARVLNMKDVMKIVVKCVNFIKKTGLNHRQFKTFLEECNAEHEDVVYFAAVRWLSKGATLMRFFLLRNEIAEFMNAKKQDVPELKCYQWLCDLSFLTDIMSHLNNLNLHLQGVGKFVSSLFDHVKAFQRKLELLQKQLKEGDLAHFMACKKLTEENRNGNEAMKLLRSEKYTNLIENVKQEFQRRFCDFQSHEAEFRLFSNPFHCNPESAPTNMQLELIELQESSDLKSSFQDLTLDKFYSSVPASTYPALLRHASKMASLFGSTYICEKTFSTLNFNKSKWRTALTDEHLQAVLQISTTKYTPRYKKLIGEKSQLHTSH